MNPKIYSLAVVIIPYLFFVSVVTSQETEDPSLLSVDPAEAVGYVRKCRCQVTEVLDSSGQCVEHPFLVDASQKSHFNTTVKDLSCLPPLFTVVLSQEEFSPVEGGEIYVPLMNSFLSYEDHCLEYKDNVFGNINIEAKVCITAPVIPICCPGGVMPQRDSDGAVISCASSSESPTSDSTFPSDKDLPAPIHHSMDFRLPVYFGANTVDFGVVPTAVSSVSCSDGKNLTTTNLGWTDQAVVTYVADGTSLEWKSPNGQSVTLNPGEFCLGKADSDGSRYVGFFCYQNPLDLHQQQCRNRTCVRKCCDADSVFVGREGCTKVDEPSEWLPEIHNRETMQPLHYNVTVTEVYGFPICGEFFGLDSSEPYVLTDDGHLTLLHGVSYAAHRYCVDNLLDDNNSSSRIAVVCFDHQENTDSCYWQKILKSVALALSCIFILATLFVYFSVTEIFRRLPSKCVLSQSFALLLSFLCLISLQALSTGESTPFCIATGLLFYYSTLASFFWLNVMCFDMYFTIKSIVPVSECGSHLKFFALYSLYGWGLPLLFLVAVCVVDNLPLDLAHFHVIRPNIFSACHIPNQDHRARWTYLYGPMVLLLAVNVALFVQVAVTLVCQRRENARVLHGADSQARAGGRAHNCGAKPHESAVLCLKLFVVMGVTWVMEIVSFGEGDTCYVWLVTDVINALRGLFIFVIFVCKRDVIRKFKNTWGPRLPATCPLATLFAKRTPRGSRSSDPDSGASSSFWSSRKTSSTSIFALAGRRKASAAALEATGESHKMSAVNSERKNSTDVKF